MAARRWRTRCCRSRFSGADEVTKVTALLYAFVASCSLAAAAAADEGVVLSVRPDGVVVDVSQMEDVRRGTKLGFVRENGEREETGQGRVLRVKDGQAVVKLAAKSIVKKGDLVVPCPDPNEDPYADLRGALAEIQDQGGAGGKGRKKAGRVQAVAGELQTALEARDEAVESGLCDMAPHDSQIAALAEDLEKASAARRSPSARAPSRGSRSAPADKAEESDEEETPKPKASAKARGQSTQEEPEAREEAEPDAAGERTARAPEPGSADEDTGTTAPSGARPEPEGQSELGTAIGALGRILGALQGSAKRGTADSQSAESEDTGTGAPGPDKDGLQGALDVIGKLADLVPSKSKRRAKPSEQAASEEPPAPSEEVSEPDVTSPSTEAPAPSEPPTAADPPSSGAAPADSASAPSSEGSTPPTAGAGTAPGDKRLPSSLGRILRERTVKATPPAESKPPTAAGPQSSVGSPASSASPPPAEGSRPPRVTTGTAPGDKRLPSSRDRILGDRTAKARPPAESKPPDKAPGTRPESRDAKSVTVAGRVIDSKGRPLAGARVAVGNVATTTKNDGRFELSNVKPGQYEVRVSATGFGSVKRTLSVRPDGRPLSFTLRAMQGAKEGQPTTSVRRPRKFGEIDE